MRWKNRGKEGAKADRRVIDLTGPDSMDWLWATKDEVVSGPFPVVGGLETVLGEMEALESAFYCL